MRLLQRWHIWLGWLVAVPLLLWTISGLFMVSFDIDQVRGKHLRAQPSGLPQGVPFTVPQVNGRPATGLRLSQRVDGTIWIIERADGSVLTRDAVNDRGLEPVTAALARRIAIAALRAPTAVEGVRRFAADANPVDLRAGRPAWQISFADGVRVYVDADSGEVLAVRSRLWRAFDFMWGLHIMDPGGREDTHHPILIGAAALSLLSVLVGVMLLFRRRKRKLSPPTVTR